jgi:hypothetical protein
VIKAFVTVGIGAWTATKVVELAACPHVGDAIDVEGISVTCERVTIGKDVINVEEMIPFTSEEEADAYFGQKIK